MKKEVVKADKTEVEVAKKFDIGVVLSKLRLRLKLPTSQILPCLISRPSLLVSKP